jgi:hypothetical protein
MSDFKDRRDPSGYIVFLIVVFIWSSAPSQPMMEEMLGRYLLVYDSTYIWPDGRGGYDYVRKFISEVQLDEEGRAVLSRPATPILSKDDKITITAYTRLASGEILDADSVDMVTRIMNGDRRWIFVNFRQAEPGAVLHLEWLLTSKEVNLAGKRPLGRTVPVETAVIIITVPETWIFNFAMSQSTTANQRVEITPLAASPATANYYWIANNIPGLINEEFSLPVERLIPCLYFSFSFDRSAVGPDTTRIDWSYLSELYYRQLKAFSRQNSALYEVIDSISEISSDKRELAMMAYYWLGDNFKSFESDISLDGDVNEAVDRGGGTQAESGAILFEMFEELEIPSMAYLVSTKEVGDPLMQLPALFWFDRLLLRAEFDKDTIWIDPLYKLAQMNILPFEDQGALGLCVTEAGGKFVRVPMPDYQENGKALHLRLNFDATGSLRGEATEIYSGALIPEISSFLRNLDELEWKIPWEKKLGRSFPGARIDRFVVIPPDSTSKPYRIGYTFNTGPIVRPFADRAFIPLDLLGRWADLPDLSDKPRRTPIDIRRPRFELERISLSISYPYEVEYLPGNYSENLDIGDVYSVIRGDKNSVTITRGLGLRKAIIPFSEYNSLRSFLGKARNEADKHIILRRVD